MELATFIATLLTMVIVSVIAAFTIITMDAVQDLRNAVDGLVTVATQGFADTASALEELSRDLGTLSNSANIETEVTRLQGVVAGIQTNLSNTAQAIRDAVPTPDAPPAEVPPVEAPPVTEG